MISLKRIRLLICFSLSLTLGQAHGENQLPNLAANLDEQSLSNPSYILGQHWFRRLNGSKNLIIFPPAYNYLRNALSRLLPYTGLYQKNIEIGLLNSSKSNAFVLPGNHLFIYSDMLSKIKSEQTFFALLAHELAHLDLRHYERQNQQNQQEQSKAMLMMGAGIAAALAGVQGDASYALLLSGIANKEENRLSYSRFQEQEADRQAKRYLINAGLNEHATSDLFLSFFQSSIGQEPIEFLSTHPIPETRLADSLDTSPPISILKQGDQTSFNQFRATMLAYRASFLANPNSYLNSQLSKKRDQDYAKALVAYLTNNKENALEIAQTLDTSDKTHAYLKAKILLMNQDSQEASRLINEKLNINQEQLSFIELSNQIQPINKVPLAQRSLLQFEKDIINRIHLKQATQTKNLALTWAYKAKIAFNKGQAKAALTLLNRAIPLAEGKDKIKVSEIENEIKERLALEKSQGITQDY